MKMANQGRMIMKVELTSDEVIKALRQAAYEKKKNTKKMQMLAKSQRGFNFNVNLMCDPESNDLKDVGAIVEIFERF